MEALSLGAAPQPGADSPGEGGSGEGCGSGGCGDCGGGGGQPPGNLAKLAAAKGCHRCGGRPHCNPRGDLLCAECLTQVVHKAARNVLTRTRSASPKEHILICFSGNGGSLALAKIVALMRASVKGTPYALTLCHVLDARAALSCDEAYGRYKAAVAASAASAGLVVELVELPAEGLAALQACRQAGGLTAWQDLREALRLRALTDFALARGCTRMAFGESASVLAARVVSDLAKGRSLEGARYAMEQGLEGQEGVRVIRPLFDTLEDEVALYVHAAKLTPALLPLDAWTRLGTGCGSLNDLARDFVALLQRGKKGSVPTILRSIGKIEPYDCEAGGALSDAADGEGAGEDARAGKGVALSQGGAAPQAPLAQPQACEPQHPKGRAEAHGPAQRSVGPGGAGKGREGVMCQRCCEQRASVKRPKDGSRVCKECFFVLLEDEVHRTIVDGRLFKRGERVCVAASGGKDSTVLAEMMTLLNKRHDYGLELVLLSIDEGISGYRDDSLETVKRNQIQYQLPLTILSYRDLYGWTMDDIVAHIGKTNNCTFCGVFRRQALDRGAALQKVDKIVTGHNADDVAETVLLNILRGDVARLQRCTQLTTGGDREDSIPRSKPFKYTYEKEIVMYAHFKKLDYFSTECIYSLHAYRGFAREFLKELERANPSTIVDIIKGGEKCLVKGTVKMPSQGTCERCGYISSQPLCKACVLLDDLHNLREKRRGVIEYERESRGAR